MLFTFSLVILTVFTNLFFIPIYGMSGASLGTFLSIIVYIVLLLGFLQWKVNVSPLSFNLLKITGIVLLMLGISWGWKMTLSPLITDVFSNYTFALFMDALLKTFVSLGIGVVLVYVFRVSEDVNSLARKYLGKIGIRI